MNKEEYNQIKEKLLIQYENEQRKAANMYAQANRLFNVGDVIKDHRTTIQVESYGTYFNLSNPDMVYEGPELTKKGIPFKDGRKARIYQSNIV